MLIVFIGPPGSGKGTQSVRLAKRLGIPQLSTGEVLREVKTGTSPLAQQIASAIDRGELVSDELIMELVAVRLEQSEYRNGCIFDGVPRTVSQAIALDELLETKQTGLDHVISLVVPESELVSRLMGRASVQHRDDDVPEAISQRLSIFNDRTAKLLEYYQSRSVVRFVDGVGSTDVVFDRILTGIRSNSPTRR